MPDLAPSFLCFLPEVHGTSKLFQPHTPTDDAIKQFSVKRFQAQDMQHGSVVFTAVTLSNADSKMDALPAHQASPETETTVLLDTPGHTTRRHSHDGSMDGALALDSDFQEAYTAIGGFADGEDELAFEITQFFKAFEKGQEHLSLKWVPEQATDSFLDLSKHRLLLRGDELSSSSKSGLSVHSNEGTGNGSTLILGHANSTRLSGKWFEDADSDSLSMPLSGPLPSSGSVYYTGHSFRISYSGSVSHRSDSSSTSTRSFAFPVLQCEWNSSPVKMVQPDLRYWRWQQQQQQQQQLHQQGTWKSSWKSCICAFFCCKCSTSWCD